MAYQALYRQWRPTGFASMVSQEAVIATLRNQVMTGRIAHAYLFCGSRGTGKTSTAKIMSRAINCEHPVDGDACGECPTCRALLADESLDVVEIDAASNNGVDEIRDLRESVKYPPQGCRYKVYIIDEVHMLSTQAFNALLKTLEEPPVHAVFILATTEPQKLPATILSRCQRFDFGRIPAAKIAGRLRQAAEGAGAEATEEALNMIARAAEGGMRDALSILDMCLGYQRSVDEALVHRVLGTSDRSFLFRFAECLQNGDAASLMAMIDELMRSGREAVVFAKDVSQHLRALMLAKCCGEELPSLLEITQEDADAYIGQSDGFTETRLMRMMELFMAVETELRYASSPRIALETAALKACLRTSEVDAAALNDRIAELEKQVTELTDKLQSGVYTAAPAPQAAPAKAAQSKEQTAVPAVPDAPKVLTPTGKSPEECWKAALNTLKRSAVSLFSVLKMGDLIRCENQVFYWKPKQMIYAGMLNKEESRTAITAALTEAAGIESRLEVVHDGLSKSPEQKQTDVGFVDLMKETFGGENVSVQEGQ